MELYEALRSAETDEDRARVIANAFEELEARFPNLSDMATNSALRETELRLMREIEELRKEIADVRKETADIRKDIAGLRNDIVDVKMASLRYSLATVGLLAAFMTLLKLFG